MSVQTDIQLAASAVVVRDETVALANSATRVGTLLNNIVENKINVDKIDTDGTFAADSDTIIPSQAAVKEYVDADRVYTKKVSLTSAEILQLFTTPKALVAAPGAGKVIMPLRILMNLTYGTITYTTNTNLVLGLGTIFATTFTGALGFSTNQLATFTLTTAAGSSTPAASTNVALTLSAATGNPLAGDSTLDVYITYKIVTL